MTLRNLIDNGLLNNVRIIYIDNCGMKTSFQIEDDFLNVYIDVNDIPLCFPLDNEVVFEGLYILIKDKHKIEYYLSFLTCTTIDPESFKNKYICNQPIDNSLK